MLYGEICAELGIEKGLCLVRQFSDGETNIEIKENVRGLDVFVLQSCCKPCDTNIMELLIMMDALKRASAKNDHCGHPLLRLCAPGQKGGPQGTDFREARG